MGILFYSLTSRCSSQNGIVSLMIRPAVFLAGGWAYMKLRQNGTVSFLIRLADFQARGDARMKLHFQSWSWFNLGALCIL